MRSQLRTTTQSCGDDYKPEEYWDIFYETLRNIRMVSMGKHAELVTNNYAVMWS